MKVLLCMLLFCVVCASATVTLPTLENINLIEPAAASVPATNAPVLESVSIVPPTALLASEACTTAACRPGGPTGRLAGKRHHHLKKSKLDIALSAIKQDILVRDRQIKDEKHWVKQVRLIVEQYNQKVKRVLADIEKTKGEVKVLFKKKKQIENLKIQRQLERKLKDATKDLTTLKSALQHVKNKASEFSKTKNEIKKTIISIHTQLAKLKGVKDPKKLRAIANKLSRDD